MKRIKYLLILLIYLYSTSCKQEEIVKEPEEIVVGGKSIKIQDSTFIIYNHHSTGLTAQDGNIIWDEPSGVLKVPRAAANQMGHRYIENGIFICDLDTSGILRRIVKLDSTSTNYIINTGDADFEDFFSDLNVQLSTDESETMLESSILDHVDISDALTDENGVLHPFKIVDYDEDENVLSSWSAYQPVPDNLNSSVTFDVKYDFSGYTLYEYTKNALTTKLYVSSGNIEFKNTTTVNISIKTAWSGIIPHAYVNTFSCSNSSKFHIYSQLKLDAQTNYHIDRTSHIKKLYSKRYCYMVGIVPVWITVRADLYAHAKATSHGEGTVTYGLGLKNVTSTVGMLYKKGDGWSATKKFSYEIQKEPLLVTGEASATDTSEIYPRVEVYLYGVAGPYAEIVPYLSAGTHSAFDYTVGGEKNVYWNSYLKTGLYARLGAEVKILGHSLANYSHKFTLVNPYTLYYAPDKIEISGGDGQTGTKGGFLGNNISAKVLDSWGKPIGLAPVYFEPVTSGDGTAASRLEFTKSDGLSTTQWKLGNTNAQQNMKASIKTNSTTVISSVTFKATAH